MASSSFLHLPQTPPIQLSHTHAAAADMNCHCSVDPATAEDAVINGPPHSRPMGATEQNWCRAVAGGTGITVLGLLFSRLLQPSHAQHAIDTVQRLHPRLRSKLVWVNGIPGFHVSPHPFLKLEVISDAIEPLSAIVSSEMKAESISQSDNKEKFKEDKTQNQLPAVNSIEAIVESGLQFASKANSKAENHQKPTSAIDSSEGIAESKLKDEDKEKFMDQNYQKPSCANESIEAMAESYMHAEGVVNPEEESHHSDWLSHVENELNINIWPEEHNSVEPVQMFVARLCHLPRRRSALILRLHTAACDGVSAATLISDILHALSQTMAPSRKQNVSNPNVANGDYVGEDGQLLKVHAKISSSRESEEHLSAIEDLIPRGQGNKPFWAHGVDLLGYSLGSMRHASLPFQQPDLPRRSQIIRSALSVEHTQALLQACKKENTNLFGALSAASLKATTAVKELGNRSEHFAIISLVDCRRLLDPVLSASTIGFYHSAVMNTHHINETTEFWSLARRCSNSLDNAMKNRKHFTDMGDVNFLMSQAIRHPNLTPASSLRTSLHALFRETVIDDLEKDSKELLGLEDYMGCSSIHGVGPGLATFECIRNGSLHCTHVYPAPLHSQKQMQKVVHLMVDVLVSSLSVQLSH